jgi:hypothetical protein
LGGEHAELATGAAALAEKSWFGEAALEACAVDEIGAERFDFIGDGFEEACAGFAIGGAEGGEGLVGCFHGEVDLGFARSMGEMAWKDPVFPLERDPAMKENP